MNIRSCIAIVICLLFGTVTNAEPFDLTLRRQVASQQEASWFRTVTESRKWDPQKTAVVVCDMWDSHHCYRAVQRVGELAPRMNQFLVHARKHGATIIHAPSSCMSAYEAHQARQRAMKEPIVEQLPDKIGEWCHWIDAEHREAYPIDQSDGGEDDTPAEHAAWEVELKSQGRNPKAPWLRQVDSLEIDAARDFISDRGNEIWSILANRSIEHVMLVGVHTNMCVLGRPFGLRQLAKNGKDVVLVRDLTDTMYNPASRPFVSHFTGTDLIISYIERYVCPTISSEQLLGGDAFRFQNDQRPTIAMMIGESEYQTETTLPNFAIEHLGKDYRVVSVLEHPSQSNQFIGLEQLGSADLLLVSVRRKPLPPEQLDAVRAFVAAGKPVIGIRTASHAFCLRNKEAPAPLDDWPEFDAQVFGGHYTNHHGNSLKSTIETSEESHAILKGIKRAPFAQGGSLYKTSPLANGTRVLLIGRAEGVTPEPVAWTFQREDGGKSFYTSLGHVKDFENPAFTKLLRHAIDWAIAN